MSICCLHVSRLEYNFSHKGQPKSFAVFGEDDCRLPAVCLAGGIRRTGASSVILSSYETVEALATSTRWVKQERTRLPLLFMPSFVQYVATSVVK